MTSTPAHIVPYVEALGEAKAIDFLTAFGGSALVLSGSATSRVRTVLDEPEVARLRDTFGSVITRVPLARAWVAQQRPTPPQRDGLGNPPSSR